MDSAPAVSMLIDQAVAGRQEAWNEIVRRYLPLVFSVIHKVRIGPADQQDIAQAVWTKLYQNLDRIRDPEALPGWIAICTKHEALRVLKGQSRTAVPVDPQFPPFADRSREPHQVDESILQAERAQMIRDSLEELPERAREFLILLAQDPPLSYRQIAEDLGLAVGSIGPLRARYLERLRNTRSMRRYFDETSPQLTTGQ